MPKQQPDVVDGIANAVLKTFDSLPAKFKPRTREAPAREWIPLAGIVVTEGQKDPVCVSLATGMKCLPRSKISSAKGCILHDCHAEILAIRSFNLVKDTSVPSLIVVPRDPEAISREEPQMFSIRSDIRLNMYCSEAPCGDASMELRMASQEDATPWAESPIKKTQLAGKHELLGRGHFSQLGIVRRKPARADAPDTLSKSCSDKLAMKQCTSLLSSVTSVLVHPENAYLRKLVLPASQFVPIACSRAFTPLGRMSGVQSRSQHWQGGYSFVPVEIGTTDVEFDWCRRAIDLKPDCSKLIPSNVSAVWNPALQETIISGVRQGWPAHSPRGASAISRKLLWQAMIEILTGAMAAQPLQNPSATSLESALSVPGHITYENLKESSGTFAFRRAVKEDVRSVALGRWQRNTGDDFAIDL